MGLWPYCCAWVAMHATTALLVSFVMLIAVLLLLFIEANSTV